MKVFFQSVRASAAARREFALAYAHIAADGPRVDYVGICYNVKQVMDERRDGYKMTKALFRCVTGQRGDDYPLRYRPDAETWGVRKKWCAAFAESFTTGFIVVDAEMEASLELGVDSERQVK